MGEAGHVFEGPGEHAAEHVLFNYRVFGAELAGGADEDLAGGSGLCVEGYGVCGYGVGALEVAEFDELVGQKAGVAVGDEEMAFAGGDRGPGDETGDGGSGSENDDACVEVGQVGDGVVELNWNAGEEIAGGAGRITDAVGGHAETSGEAGAEGGFGCGQLMRVEDFDGDTALGVEGVLAMDLGHLLVVGCDPERATGEEFSIGGEFGGEIGPEALGVAGEGELGVGIIHDGQVAHAGGGGTSANDVGGFENDDAEACLFEFAGAGGTDDSGPDNDGIIFPNGQCNIVLMPQRIHVIDSHTGGEPTRLVVGGGPPLGGGTMRERLELFRDKFDNYRTAVCNEPRASDAVVGALLCEPTDPTCSAGVIFFNNVGYLHMCGHGTIGLAVTLAYMGRIQPGIHRIETPVGVVEAELHENREVTITNVPSYRAAAGVTIDVPGYGPVTGDVAWGGNWFFLVYESPVALELARLDELTAYSWAIRQAVNAQGYPEVDHIELYGPPVAEGSDSRNFVLCPGKAYDRSPCGTGTSAKLACLYAAGKLVPGQVWRQESVIGSWFDGWVTVTDGVIHPHIRGSAHVTAEGDLLIHEGDPFGWGI